MNIFMNILQYQKNNYLHTTKRNIMKKLTYTLLGLALIFTSCKKDTPVEPKQPDAFTATVSYRVTSSQYIVTITANTTKPVDTLKVEIKGHFESGIVGTSENLYNVPVGTSSHTVYLKNQRGSNSVLTLLAKGNGQVLGSLKMNLQ